MQEATAATSQDEVAYTSQRMEMYFARMQSSLAQLETSIHLNHSHILRTIDTDYEKQNVCRQLPLSWMAGVPSTKLLDDLY